MANAEAAPQRLDRYDLVSLLGQGAMGTVYLARDSKLEREVALKVVNPSLAANETARGLFHREAKAIAKLQHPNIIQLFDYSGLDSPSVYLVVERLKGKNLADTVEARMQIGRGPLDCFAAAAVGYEICLGLEHAHNQGIVHRDLKPENVFIEPDGRVVLCDFGVARAYRSSASPHTLASQQTKLAGSPLYMSPEQILNPQQIGPASDLFSLGSMLYYLATCEHAFAATNMHKVLKAVTEGAPGPRLETNPRIPVQFTQVIKKLLQKDPERRYATAQQTADALLEVFALSPHRDPRRLLRQTLAEVTDRSRLHEKTQNVQLASLGVEQESPSPNNTMVFLTQKKAPPPNPVEEIVQPAPILLRSGHSREQLPKRVLLIAASSALAIIVIGLIVREVDAFEPLRAFFRDLLRRY